MQTTSLPKQRLEHLTFKGNRRQTRYGWLRLTPAYSVHLVEEILDAAVASQPGPRVLDPFCGTGTTAMVCAEKGLLCDTADINPFLVWLAKTKTYPYSTGQLAEFRTLGLEAERSVLDREAEVWAPPLHQIEKWWTTETLAALGRIACFMVGAEAEEPVHDLLKVAFCQTMIRVANVSFGHQSMSFKQPETHANLSLLLDDHPSEAGTVLRVWREAVRVIADSARSLIQTKPSVHLCDARHLDLLSDGQFTCVITSPPYPNRMSYIRELRPYMYWLRYLSEGRAAGEMDWQAIGGTWGCATSNVAKWTPTLARCVPFPGFEGILTRIAERSSLLANYVHKYFYDMIDHCLSLFRVVHSGGRLHYIVGNSKFYDVLLPVEEIYREMFLVSGFIDAKVEAIRKRTSKKELFEFVVSAQKP